MTVMYRPHEYLCVDHDKPVIKLISSKSIWHCPTDVEPCNSRRFYYGDGLLTRHDLITVEEYYFPALRR